MIKKLLVGLLLTGAVYGDNVVELNLNETDLVLGAKMELPNPLGIDEGSERENYIGVKFMTADRENSSIQSDKDLEYYGEVNFLMTQDFQVDMNSFVTAGVGAKINVTEDFVSMPLGLELAYTIDLGNGVPLKVGGSFYYAPEVLAFEDAESYKELTGLIEVGIMEDVWVNIGMRSMNTNYVKDSKVGGDFEYNKSAFIGIKAKFNTLN